MSDNALNNELLVRLQCPETRQSLSPVDEALLNRINRSIEKGELKTRGGRAITSPVQAALIRQDKAYIYLVQPFPMMLPEDAIEAPSIP